MTNGYDNKNICPTCGGHNTIEIKDQLNSDILEAETTCGACGHRDYWALGFYMSRESECYETDSL